MTEDRFQVYLQAICNFGFMIYVLPIPYVAISHHFLRTLKFLTKIYVYISVSLSYIDATLGVLKSIKDLRRQFALWDVVLY